MGQFSNPVATHPRTNEVEVPPPRDSTPPRLECIRVYVKFQGPFKVSFKLKLCGFVSVPSLLKKEIDAFDCSVLNNLL